MSQFFPAAAETSFETVSLKKRAFKCSFSQSIGFSRCHPVWPLIKLLSAERPTDRSIDDHLFMVGSKSGTAVRLEWNYPHRVESIGSQCVDRLYFKTAKLALLQRKPSKVGLYSTLDIGLLACSCRGAGLCQWRGPWFAHSSSDDHKALLKAL